MILIALRLALLTSLLGVVAAQAAEPTRPNIVVLFAAAAGYADFGFQQQPDPDLGPLTPHIDSIAERGVRLTNAYACGAVCSPSRAGLLSGRYQQRFGHETNIPPGYMKGGMALAEKTVADRLRALGYATGIVGKWHLGYPPAYRPNERGFDWFYGLLQGSRAYFPIANPTPHRVIQENGEPTPEEGYVTDRIGAAAARFVAAHADRPFFLFVSFTAPHGPLQAKAEHLLELEHIEPQRRRKYAGLVKALDENVGVVLDALRTNGLEDDTLVVFTNDNGGQTRTGAVNTPLRGRKGQVWEGGIRVPMPLRWPGRIAPGGTIDDPVIGLDLLPTFVSVAGGEIDPDWKLDGVDIGPRLCGAEDALTERALFWRTLGPEGPAAVRRGDWKLVVEREADEDDRVHLFELADDIAEARDVSAAHPDEVEALRAELRAWEAQLADTAWASRARRTGCWGAHVSPPSPDPWVRGLLGCARAGWCPGRA